MPRLTTRRVLALSAAVLAVVVGGSAAIAASGGGSASPTAFLDSVAQHLGISSKKLTDAVKAAQLDQVDAALKAGRITQAQADELKARIEAGDTPLLEHGFGFSGPRPFGHGAFGFGLFGDKLSAAASYLGLTEAQLQVKLASGQSLAQIAKAQGKSVDGLENAMLAQAQKKLDQAVAQGQLTKAQETELLGRLEERLGDLVNRSFNGVPPGWRAFHGPPAGFRGQRFDGPPPPFFGTTT